MTEGHDDARRNDILQATDDVVELAAELADWYERSRREHSLESGDRDALLSALSDAVGKLRRVANAS